MGRWRWAFLPPLLCSLYLVAFSPRSLNALADTDTAYLLSVIRANPDPVSHAPQSVWNWFKGDWPLHNHFYRPISTLSFELDSRIHGNDGSGYVLTNSLIAASCVLLLFWFLRELTDRPATAGGAALLFGLWTIGVELPVWLPWLLAPILLGGLWRNGFRLGSTLLTVGSLYFLIEEAGAVGHPFSSAIIGWLPGRTASIMTAFCLVAMAAYARFERLSATRDPAPEPTPLDPPATRNTRVESRDNRIAWPWLAVSFLAALLALGSHEQAIMLPGAIVGVAVTLRLKGYRVRWQWPMSFFLVLAGYFLLRHELLPPEISRYQAQQLRFGPGAIGALLGYALPAGMGSYLAFRGMADLGSAIWVTAGPYAAIGRLFSNLAAYAVARRRWVDALAGWALSIIAFLPMAWIKPFPHYDYWPMAMRSLFVAALAAATGTAVLSAWSPRAVRLPPRQAPAPGSLPHP